jgi:hypothetical protein
MTEAEWLGSLALGLVSDGERERALFGQAEVDGWGMYC